MKFTSVTTWYVNALLNTRIYQIMATTKGVYFKVINLLIESAGVHLTFLFQFYSSTVLEQQTLCLHNTNI